MAKKTKKVELYERTLIWAVERSFDDPVVCPILCEHKAEVDPRDAVAAAFREWAKTDPENPETEFTNWSDSFSIPDRFLKQQGITLYMGLRYGGRLQGCTFEHEINVDHNESLVDQ